MPPVQPVADSEPVAWTWQHLKQWYVTNDEERARELAWDGVKVEQLYRHAQPVPVVSADLLHTAASAIEDLLTTKDRTGACVWFDLPFRLRSAANAQPAPVVHGEVARAIEELKRTLVDCNRYNYCSDAVARVEVACRAAMLQAGNSPAQSDCCPAQNVVAPAQNVVAPAQIPIDHGYLPECECSGCKATARICTEMAVNSLVIPNEMTSEQAYEIGYYYGDPVDVFARGANWMRQHIIDSTLAAAPQLPGSDPATVPGKWIPVSVRMPDREVDVQVYCPDKKEQMVAYLERNELEGYFRFATWRTGDDIYCQPTHWMQLPAGPREVKGE
ncbi:TPA: DUF551 domain-containing protein [Klebsiella pneumoniae]|nr:DUF551 domain-containing protein [Klebsiella pneumoniae]